MAGSADERAADSLNTDQHMAVHKPADAGLVQNIGTVLGIAGGTGSCQAADERDNTAVDRKRGIWRLSSLPSFISPFRALFLSVYDMGAIPVPMGCHNSVKKCRKF